MEQKLDLQGKKGFKLLSKILLVVMIPMVLLVWMAGSAIKTVGTTTSSRLINHELKATSYAMEIYIKEMSTYLKDRIS